MEMDMILLVLTISFMVTYLLWFLCGKGRWSKLTTLTVDTILILLCAGTVISITIIKGQAIPTVNLQENEIKENKEDDGSQMEKPSGLKSAILQTEKPEATMRVTPTATSEVTPQAAPVATLDVRPIATPEVKPQETKPQEIPAIPEAPVEAPVQTEADSGGTDNTGGTPQTGQDAASSVPEQTVEPPQTGEGENAVSQTGEGENMAPQTGQSAEEPSGAMGSQEGIVGQ